MSLFTRPIRPASGDADDPVERYLESLRSSIRTDPLYRRRLRGATLNRFVAAREHLDGAGVAPRGGSRMGRLGRATLYASVTLAATAATVLGASGQALPGDPLYPVKLRVEELRYSVVPPHLHAVLAADVLGERLDEMTRLIETGRLADAQALEPAIDRGIDGLALMVGPIASASDPRITGHLAALERVIAGLPPQAQAAIGARWSDAVGAGAVGGPHFVAPPVAGTPAASASPGTRDSGGRPAERPASGAPRASADPETGKGSGNPSPGEPRDPQPSPGGPGDN